MRPTAPFMLAGVLLLAAAAQAARQGPLEVPQAAAAGVGGSRRLQGLESTLELNTTQFTSNGQWVAASWKKPTSHPEDIVAVYVAPVSATFDVVQFIKAKKAVELQGSATFRLLNIRQDFQLALISNSTGTPTVLAVSPVMRNKISNQPTLIHVAPGAIPTAGVSVQWVTRNASQPAVRWGTSATQLNRVAVASKRTYVKQEIIQACGWGNRTIPSDANMLAVGKGWIEPGTLHLANLTGLQPSTTYWYRVVDLATGGTAATASEVASFTTPAPVGSTETLTFLVGADLGTGNNDDGSEQPQYNPSVGAYAVVQGMNEVAAAVKARFGIVAGDLSYSDGTLYRWTQYTNQAAPLLTSIMTLTAQGNHERDYYYNKDGIIASSGDGLNSTKSKKYGGECGIPYERLFAMPSTNHIRQWSSYNVGPVHILMLSSELNMLQGSPQQRFANADLVAVNRTLTPFVVAMWHRGMYVACKDDDNDFKFGQAMRDQGWDGILNRRGVDLVVTGHFHIYQRTCPVFNGTCVPQNKDGTNAAPIHIGTGWGGPTDAGNVPVDQQGRSIYPYMKRISGNTPRFGFLKVSVNRTILHVEAIKVDWNYNLETKASSGSMKPDPIPFDTVIIRAKKL